MYGEHHRLEADAFERLGDGGPIGDRGRADQEHGRDGRQVGSGLVEVVQGRPGRRGRQGEDGGGHQSKGLGHLVGVVTWEQRRRARAEGSELQRLQRISREQRQGGDQDVGARQTQDRPQPCPGAGDDVEVAEGAHNRETHP